MEPFAGEEVPEPTEESFVLWPLRIFDLRIRKKFSKRGKGLRGIGHVVAGQLKLGLGGYPALAGFLPHTGWQFAPGCTFWGFLKGFFFINGNGPDPNRPIGWKLTGDRVGRRWFFEG